MTPEEIEQVINAIEIKKLKYQEEKYQEIYKAINDWCDDTNKKIDVIVKTTPMQYIREGKGQYQSIGNIVKPFGEDWTNTYNYITKYNKPSFKERMLEIVERIDKWNFTVECINRSRRNIRKEAVRSGRNKKAKQKADIEHLEKYGTYAGERFLDIHKNYKIMCLIPAAFLSFIFSLFCVISVNWDSRTFIFCFLFYTWILHFLIFNFTKDLFQFVFKCETPKSKKLSELKGEVK